MSIDLKTVMEHIVKCVRERKHWEHKNGDLSIAIDKDDKGYGATIRLVNGLEHKHFEEVFDAIAWIQECLKTHIIKLSQLLGPIDRFLGALDGKSEWLLKMP